MQFNWRDRDEPQHYGGMRLHLPGSATRNRAALLTGTQENSDAASDATDDESIASLPPHLLAARLGDLDALLEALPDAPTPQQEALVSGCLRDRKGRSALMLAALKGHTRVAVYLLQRMAKRAGGGEGAAADAISSRESATKAGETILHCAVRSGDVAHVRAILDELAKPAFQVRAARRDAFLLLSLVCYGTPTVLLLDPYST